MRGESGAAEVAGNARGFRAIPEGLPWFWLGNAFVRLYPALVLACAAWAIVRRAVPSSFGDEWRYLWYAQNLLEGYFSPTDNAMIWNGPGYPIFLMPWVAAGVSHVLIKSMNAVLLTGAVIYLHRAIALYAPVWRATVGGLALGFSPLAYSYLHLIYTEILSVFLVCATAYHFCRAHEKKWHIGWAGLFLGCLVLTKVSFGAALTVCLAAVLVRGRGLRAVALPVLGIAYAMCIPWFIYTHHITGKWLSWSTAGGSSLYWMASPHPEDLGDWFHHRQIFSIPQLERNHGEFHRQLRGDLAAVAGTELERVLPGIGKLCSSEANDAFLRRALQNIRARPGLYLRNWVLNLGRLFFDAPFTFGWKVDGALWGQTLGLLCLLGIVGVLRWQGRWGWAPEVRGVAVFATVALALLSLLSAYARFFLPLYPAYLLFGLAGLRIVRHEC